jgi:hypothetical protein
LHLVEESTIEEVYERFLVPFDQELKRPFSPFTVLYHQFLVRNVHEEDPFSG